MFFITLCFICSKVPPFFFLIKTSHVKAQTMKFRYNLALEGFKHNWDTVVREKKG